MSTYRPYPNYKSRAMPFATFGCPVGADDLRPEGATYDSPGHRPGFHAHNKSRRPNGASQASPGHRPGSVATPIFQALKGRYNP
jgi:hypothetical protein